MIASFDICKSSERNLTETNEATISPILLDDDSNTRDSEENNEENLIEINEATISPIHLDDESNRIENEENNKETSSYEYEDGLPVWRKCDGDKMLDKEDREIGLESPNKLNLNFIGDAKIGIDINIDDEDTELEDEEQKSLNKRKIKKFSELEILLLIKSVEKYGHRWVSIADKYKKYFNDRSAKNLASQYDYLKKKKNFNALKKKGALNGNK